MENEIIKLPNDYRGEYIDYHLLHTAYCEFEWVRHDINAIYAYTAIYAYWSYILECQIRGVNSGDMDFISKNMNNYVEAREHVINRIRTAVLSVIRIATALNGQVKRCGGERFIIRRLSRDAAGHYDILEAEALAKEIAILYEHYHGKAITDTRWDRM